MTPWTAACQASLSFTISQSLLKLMSIESVMPSNHLILRYSLIFMPSIFPSIRVFSNESALCLRWPKYWSFSFSISPSNEQSGLISFRIDWFDILGVQGTFKSLLQHHNLKASVLWCSTFVMVQLSHPYRTTEKTLPLTIQTFVGKVVSLLFNMHLGLSQLSSKEQASLSFMAAVTICSDFGVQEVCHCFHSLPTSICQEVMGTDTMILTFQMLSFKSAFSCSSFFFLIFFISWKLINLQYCSGFCLLF